MENIYIEGSNNAFFVPKIDFNAQTGICTIEGESFLENIVEFYRPLQDWLTQYCNEVKQPIELNFKLTYFNSSSSKSFLDILYVLKDYEDKGGKVTVNWYYKNPDVLEEVEDFILDTDLNINAIEM